MMRIVVFTGNPLLESTPWWPILRSCAPGPMLLLRQTVSREPRLVATRFWRNVRRHGPLFIPYRVGVAALDAMRPARPTTAPSVDADVQVIEATNIHDPEIVTRVRQWAPDLGVSLGAPILRTALFRAPRLGTINLHLGRVPDFRGAPPGFWELHAGAESVGATVHWVDEGLDTGDVIARAEAPIYPDDTLRRVQARADELGARVLRGALCELGRGDVGRTRQVPGGRTFRSPTLNQRIRLATRIATRRALRRLMSPRYVAKTLGAMALLATWRPVRDVWRSLRGRHPVRVFTFHRVTNLCRDGMTVSPLVFRRQLEYIARHHEVVPLARGLDALRQGERLRRPLAVITFDDGYQSVFEYARPIMESRAVVGCCFLSTGLVGTDRRFEHDSGSPVRRYLDVMSWDMVRSLSAAGWATGAHTVNHPRLAACADGEWQTELSQPILELRATMGEASPALAYPFGGSTDIRPDQVQFARRAGYAACFSNFGGENVPPVTDFELRRLDVGGDHAGLAWRALAHGIRLADWRWSI